MVDVAAGHSDSQKTSPWQLDTLVNAFSVGKGVLAIVLADCVAKGLIDIDQSVSSVWPELRAAHNSSTTVRDMAGHRAGLPAVSVLLENTAIYQWSMMRQALEQQEPWWTPGATHGYHVNTYGFLLGEILRRVTQSDPSQLLDPFRVIVEDGMFFGVPDSQLHRVAHLEWNPPETALADFPNFSSLEPETQLKLLTYSNPSQFSGVGAVNTRQWRQIIHPSTNLHCTARSVALLYNCLNTKQGRIPSSVLTDFSRTVSFGTDVILGSETHFGTGFQLPTVKRTFGPNRDTVGHYGAGGAVGFYDSTTNISFGYVMNKMGQGWQNTRNQSLINALYDCL